MGLSQWLYRPESDINVHWDKAVLFSFLFPASKNTWNTNSFLSSRNDNVNSEPQKLKSVLNNPFLTKDTLTPKDLLCLHLISLPFWTSFLIHLWYIQQEQWKWKSLSRVQLFCDPTDYTVHGILQARILDWVAFPTVMVEWNAYINLNY